MAIEPSSTVMHNETSSSQLPSSGISGLVSNSNGMGGGSSNSTNGGGGGFANSVIVLPDAPVQSFAQRKLSTLFESEVNRIDSYSDEHWKTPEFPLARIKKIMRMDEDVKMISGEVPVLLSKTIELFVTELTLRSWMLTEDSKRRTVQRSDIAMAIAKNDMFDFLIDIVPREEINSRNKSDSSVNQSSVLSPELIQVYLQLLAGQNNELQSPIPPTTTTTSNSSSGGKRGTPSTSEHTKGTESAAQLTTNAILQQQLQLIQQIAHLQQQISKTTIPPVVNPSSYDDSTASSSVPLPVVDSSTDVTESTQNHRSSFVSTTVSTSNTSADCLTTETTSTTTDLLLPNSLAPVTPFLSELTVSQFNPSHQIVPPSSNTAVELTGPNVQRYVINPVDHTGPLHSISTSSSIGQTGMPLVSSLHTVTFDESEQQK